MPWDDLKYIFGEIMYGGHIVEDWDRRLAYMYLELYLREELLEGIEFFPRFSSPPSGTNHKARRGPPPPAVPVAVAVAAAQALGSLFVSALGLGLEFVGALGQARQVRCLSAVPALPPKPAHSRSNKG